MPEADLQTNEPGTAASVAGIDELVALRRQAAGIAPDDPTWGLALSGGGIRSATFALGLMKGLAERGLMRRFDYLSTVSGGGYAGAAVGKLYHDRDAAVAPAAHAQQTETGLGRMNATWMAWWLRATSRYLTPRGRKDMLHAAALGLRNFIAIHLELALVFLAVGAISALLDFWAWRILDENLRPAHPYPEAMATLLLQPWSSVYWVIALVPAVAAVPSIAAYWAVPSTGRMRGRDKAAVAVLSIMAVAIAYGLVAHEAFWRDVGLFHAGWVVFGLLGLGIVSPLIVGGMLPMARARLAGKPLTLGALMRWALARLRGAPARGAPAGDGATPGAAAYSHVRNDLTRWLTLCLGAFLIAAAMGVLDRLAWWLATFDRTHARVWFAPFVLAASLAVVRFLATRAASSTGAPAVSETTTMKLVHFAGLLVLALLASWWMSVVYRYGLAGIFPRGGEAQSREALLDFSNVAIVLVVFALIPLAYIGSTSRNWDFLNTSSLHMFYRGRLARSYLGAANRERFTGANPLDAVDLALVDKVSKHSTVFDVVPGDAVDLSDYAPHAGGGPVHIVNVTVNQSYDARGGLYNHDRKGQALSITSGGVHRLGIDPWRPDEHGAMRDSELATWIAVSGAAVAPGLGSQTSSGLAALLFMSGVRLGYWWPNPRSMARKKSFRKYFLMREELLGSFGGEGARYWYLSDGGHFENTGAYALLRERAALVVVSDAGADPAYAFADLENLVRKARIDLGTDIDFLRPNPDYMPTGVAREAIERFGSLGDLKDPEGSACLALARIAYPGGGVGHLVVVKPNIYHGLPVDIVNYKARSPTFPQEPTTDQFFSESQWESYFVLGQALGRELRPEFLEGLVRNDPLWTELFVPDRSRRIADAEADDDDRKPFFTGPRIATAAASGVSAAVLAGAAYAGWQGWDSYATMQAARRNEAAAALAAITSQHEQFIAGDEKQLPVLKAALAAVAQRHCRESPDLLASLPQARIFLDVASRCTDTDRSAACHALLESARNGCFVAGEIDPTTPQYWGRPYHLAKYIAAPKVAASAGRTTVAAAGAHPAASAPAADPCKGKMVYVQGYGSRGIMEAVRWKETNKDKLAGARVPRVEDVWGSAERRGESLPRPVSKTTVIYHTQDELACALALDNAGARPLAPTFRPMPGVIEAWIAVPPETP